MSSTTQGFRWTESYAVNIAELDRHHRTLFATINEPNDALAEGHGGTAAEGVLQKLVAYTKTHFAAEESLMAKHHFPGLSKHQIEHQSFIDKVAGFVQESNSGKAGMPVSLLFFLQSWLKSHILTTDKAYSAFLNERGVQ